MPNPLPFGAALLKRSFDLFFSSLGLVLTSWLIAAAFVAASLSTGKSGFFTQTRIGKDGRPFRVIKIRTMTGGGPNDRDTTVTTAHDPRITRVGRFLRRYKIDELPQLVNVFLGQMSFVGPRPDVPGFADRLSGPDRVILSLRPGITGPATLRFRNEERELARQPDPEKYNREVIFPEKVRLNRAYIESYSFLNDMKYIFWTLSPRRHSALHPDFDRS